METAILLEYITPADSASSQFTSGSARLLKGNLSIEHIRLVAYRPDIGYSKYSQVQFILCLKAPFLIETCHFIVPETVSIEAFWKSTSWFMSADHVSLSVRVSHKN